LQRNQGKLTIHHSSKEEGIMTSRPYKPYNVGVIGYGLSAKIFHIPFITFVPEFKLYAVVQRNPRPDDDAEKDYPGIKSFRSVENMLKDDAIDLVIVTTASDTHYAMTKAVLEADKNGIYFSKYYLPVEIPGNYAYWWIHEQSLSRSLSRLPTKKQRN
jgi:hypothetical protein